MPNHYTNVLVGYMPNYLEDYKEATAPEFYERDEYGGANFTLEKFVEEYKDKNLCYHVRPMPENVRNREVGSFGHSMDDEAAWYGWASRHWGTKWGTYEFAVSELGGDQCPVMMQFQSAWSAPNQECMELIIQHFEDIGFRDLIHIGLNPSDCSSAVLSPV